MFFEEPATFQVEETRADGAQGPPRLGGKHAIGSLYKLRSEQHRHHCLDPCAVRARGAVWILLLGFLSFDVDKDPWRIQVRVPREIHIVDVSALKQSALPWADVRSQEEHARRTSLLGKRDPPVLQLVRDRSEEHTSELQSLTNLVCRLLLEKKKKNI